MSRHERMSSLSPRQFLEVLDQIQQTQRGLSGSGDPVASAGSTVEVLDYETGERRRFTLRLSADSHADSQNLSVFSPLGASLVGARPGSRVEVGFMGARYHYLILAVEQHKPDGRYRKLKP